MKPLKLTKQRKILLDTMMQLDFHPTATELHDIVRLQIPTLSLATVYRNLELFHAKGMIKKIDIPGLPNRYDHNTNEHLHIQCIRCGCVDDFPQEIKIALDSERILSLGYQLTGFQIDLFGICEKCQKKDSSNHATH